MKVLVTGGSGFIGSHVVDKLRDRGVITFTYDLPAMRRNVQRNDVEFIPGSILDLEGLQGALKGMDAVFHLAAVADVKDVQENPVYAEALNVRGTINVLEAARLARVKRVIYGSTTWVYSAAQAEIVDEDTPLSAPAHFYTATKLAAEYYCRSYSHLYGVESTILRYGIPYGPRARDGAVIPIFVNKAFHGEPLTIAGDGSQFRKFVYVEDLAEGNVLALKPIAANKIYNLDGTERVTIKQIAECVQRLVGQVPIVTTEARRGDFSGKQVVSRKAKQELGWEPKVAFEEGVRRYIDWYKRRAETREADRMQVDADLMV